MIRATGTIDSPDGEDKPRREIRIGKDDSDSLPDGQYPIRRKNGVDVTLVIDGGREYKTILHRYESFSYVADSFSRMGYHMKEFLHPYGLDKRRTKVGLEFFDNFKIRISKL